MSSLFDAKDMNFKECCEKMERVLRESRGITTTGQITYFDQKIKSEACSLCRALCNFNDNKEKS